MNTEAPTINRRQWLACIWNPPQVTEPDPDGEPIVQQVAVIQGRRCLAYRSLTCSSCVERCPVDGAIQVNRGIPQVVGSVCTGCGDCQAVCPAPENAVLMIASPCSGKE